MFILPLLSPTFKNAQLFKAAYFSVIYDYNSRKWLKEKMFSFSAIITKNYSSVSKRPRFNLQTPALPLISNVILSKLLNFLDLSFLIKKMEISTLLKVPVKMN